jgi:hypothetical protein
VTSKKASPVMDLVTRAIDLAMATEPPARTELRSFIHSKKLYSEK